MTVHCDVKLKLLQAAKKQLVESGSAQRNKIYQIETGIKRIVAEKKKMYIRRILSKLVNSIIQLRGVEVCGKDC